MKIKRITPGTPTSGMYRGSDYCVSASLPGMCSNEWRHANLHTEITPSEINMPFIL